VASQPVRRDTRRATAGGTEFEERRGWLSYGLAALGISALGLAIAGSISLTTSAQPLPVKEPVTSAARTAAKPVWTEPTEADDVAAGTFAPRGASGTTDAANGTLRAAVLKEQAAQRAEELAKGADDITRAARTASSDARQSKLTAADRASREAAARLNEERIRRAVAARVAAAQERAAKEAAERAAATEQNTATERNTTPPRATEPSTSPRPSAEPDTSSIPSGGGGVAPVAGAVIGSYFHQYGVWSRYHTGLDFRAAYGTPIRAVKAGTVLFAGNSGDWAGNHVAIRHGDGKTTMSSHMSSMAVRSGQSVQAGQVIGYVGQTGRAFGAHLHFELYPVGVRYGDVYKAINPQPWLSANGVRTN
jgi:murein DD-endopeptidase MepM/ murein hydrolase activator NlpD